MFNQSSNNPSVPHVAVDQAEVVVIAVIAVAVEAVVVANFELGIKA
jgi:hypothetical protein